MKLTKSKLREIIKQEFKKVTISNPNNIWNDKRIRNII